MRNERAGLRFKCGERGDETLQILEHGEANFVRGRAIQRQLDDSVGHLPRERFSLVFVHSFSLRRSESAGSAGILPAIFEFGPNMPGAGDTPALQSLSRISLLIHSFNLRRKARGDGIAPQFSVGREQAIFDGKQFLRYVVMANFPVVRQRSIDPLQLQINFRPVGGARDDGGKKTVSVPTSMTCCAPVQRK